MLAKRIIACLDCDLSVSEGRTVKGVKFKNLIYAGIPEELAERYYNEDADEIVFLDVTASVEKRRTMTDVIKKTCQNVFIPLTIGGGINSIETIRDVLNVGADKITMNTAAVKNPELVKKASEEYGSQCIVIAIDAKRNTVTDKENVKDKIVIKTENGNCWYEVYIYGGRKATGIDAIAWAKKMEELGAGEILLTSIDADGTKTGFELDLTRAVSERLKIPVIASGGGGTVEHFYDVFTKGKADAALAASIFHFSLITIKEIKDYLKKNNVLVR